MLLGLTYQRNHTRRAPALSDAIMRQLRPDVVRVPVNTLSEAADTIGELGRRGLAAAIVAVPFDTWSVRATGEAVRFADQVSRERGRPVYIELTARTTCSATAYVERVVDLAERCTGWPAPVLLAVAEGHPRGPSWFADLAAVLAGPVDTPTPHRVSAEVVRRFRAVPTGIMISTVGAGFPTARHAEAVILAVRDVFPTLPVHIEAGWPLGRRLSWGERVRLTAARWPAEWALAPATLTERDRDLWLRAVWQQWRRVGAETLVVRGYDEAEHGDGYGIVTTTAAGDQHIASGWRSLRLAETGQIAAAWAHR